ncbi:MAG: phosphopantetheine-binding protein [Acidimicrobiales bacterium]
MSETMEPRVRTVVAVHLDVDPDRLQPGARLGEDLCVDSLAAVELVMVLEDEFDIALPEEVLGCVRTYGDVVSLVEERVERRTHAS